MQLNLNFRERIIFYTIGSCNIHCLVFEFNRVSCILSGNHTTYSEVPRRNFKTRKAGRQEGRKEGRQEVTEKLELRCGGTIVGTEKHGGADQKSCIWYTN